MMTRPRPLRAALVLAGALAAGTAGAAPAAGAARATGTVSAAAVPLSDSAKGMTCHYYAAAALLAWREPGGDWADADDRARGTRAFSAQRLARAEAGQALRLDTSALAARWQDGDAPSGALFLRPADPASAALLLASREHPDAQARPALEVEWDDGLKTRSAPLADTYFACPTHRSLGREPALRVGPGQSALVVFPFDARPGRRVVLAVATFTLLKAQPRAASVGVYRPLLPEPGAAQPGLAAAYARDDGIEAHPDVLFAERFERADWRAAWSADDADTAGAIVGADAPRRFEPLDGRALRVTIEAGKRQGLNLHWRFDRHGGEPDAAHFRYYLRLADDWDPVASGGKLPGFAGTYGRAGWGGRKSDGRNGWSARGAFFQQVAAETAFAPWRGVGSYVYHADEKSGYGDAWGWNLGPTGLLRKNRWYCIEQQVQLNRPGENDGVLRVWVDGRLAFERTDIRFRDVAELKIESVWMNVYHGGVEKAPADHTLYIDNVVVARRYIGPMGGRP